MKNSSNTYGDFSGSELNDLLTKSINGDTDSFSKLSHIIRDIAYSYFTSKLRAGKIRNVDDVDDLANNLFLSFAEQYQDIKNLEHWLRRVLFLQFISFYKTQNKRKTFELDESIKVEDDNPGPDEKMDARKMVDCLETLSDNKKEIIRMRFWEELKFAEIAERLKKNEAAVKKMFYRILEELKNKCD